MKVILISEALEEPFEMDSASEHDNPAFWFPVHVRDQVEAVLRTEGMRKVGHKHGIFGK